MFESLDDQIKHDDQLQTTTKDRVIRWVLVAVVCVLVFAGFYFGVRMLK